MPVAKIRGMALFSIARVASIPLRKRAETLGLALCLLVLPTIEGRTQTPDGLELRREIERILEPLNTHPTEAAQAIEELIRTRGREAVVEAATGPVIAALQGSNREKKKRAAWAASSLKDPLLVESLIEYLRVETFSEYAAEKALIAIGKPSVEPMIAAFQAWKTNELLFDKTAQVLGELKDPRAVGPLLEGFGAKARLAPFRCGEALGKIGGAEAVNGLAGVLKSGTPAQRSHAAKALGQIKDPRAVPALLALVKEESPAFREASTSAADALGEIGDPSALDGLLQALANPKSSASGNASRALGKMPRAAAREAVLKRLRESRVAAERVNLLRALGWIGESAVDVMDEMLKDGDQELRRQAFFNLKSSSQGYTAGTNNVPVEIQEQAREVILANVEAGRADDLRAEERVHFLTGITNARAIRLILRTGFRSDEGHYKTNAVESECLWLVPQGIGLAFQHEGPYAIAPLLDALGDSNAVVRVRAVAALQYIKTLRERHYASPDVRNPLVDRVIQRLGKTAMDAREEEAVRAEALRAIGRFGDVRHAPVLVAILQDKTAPARLRRAAVQSFNSEGMYDRSLITPLLAVLRDKGEDQYLRVETILPLSTLEHKYHDRQIAEAFRVVKSNRSEPASLRAAVARMTRDSQQLTRFLAGAVTAKARGEQKPPAPELPGGKKIWPTGVVAESSQFGAGAFIDLKAEGERQPIKAWYDKQFSDWDVYQNWSAREITILLDGEWKVWCKRDTCCLVAVYKTEASRASVLSGSDRRHPAPNAPPSNGGVTIRHWFGREEELQEFLVEIPREIAHGIRCQRNLRRIESAKDSAVRRLNLNAASAVEPAQLSPAIPGGFASVTCPDGGTYEIGTSRKLARCSFHGSEAAIRCRQGSFGFGERLALPEQ